jgi:hypothetical protein
VNGRYTRDQCCGRKLELTDRGRLLFMLNESRKERLERSEHHLGNLPIGRAAAAGSASNLHEVSPPSRAAIERQTAFAHAQDNWLTKF